MSLPMRCIAAVFVVSAALPVSAQSGHGIAEEALADLSMRVTEEGREFRAVVPFGRDEFLAASFSLEGQTTSSALHVVTADGEIGAAIPLPKPLNFPGSRIDGLIPVGDAIIGIGHIAGGPDDRRGWIVRIEPDLTISAETVLPIAANLLPISYYYGGVLDRQGRLVVAGRSDQPDFPGIGTRFNVLPNGQLEIAEVFPNGTGHEAGLRAGDVLLSANGRDLRGLSAQDAIGRLAGAIDEPLDLVVDRPGAGQRSFRMTRRMVRGMTTGVVAALNPATLDILVPPRQVYHRTSRAGLQDIGRMPDGQLVGVGWWETFDPDGSTFDKAWIVGVGSNLDVQSDQQFGQDGDSSIAQRIHVRPDGSTLVVGGLNASPEPVAFASELTWDVGSASPARLRPLREHAFGPGRTDVFRGVTTLRDGSTVVGGAFRSAQRPQFAAAAMVVGSEAPPTALFQSCEQSYVWDMASTRSGAVAVAGYCIDAQGARRAALMWSPPRKIETDAVTLASAQRLPLFRTGDTRSFDLPEPDSVLVFVPAGPSGVLTLSDETGRLVDFAAVDAGKAGLLSGDLSAGRYVVGWASEETASPPRIDVIKADLRVPEPGSDDDQILAPEAEKALVLLGYVSADNADEAPAGVQSMALTRKIAAFQLSHNLPALGHVDVATEVALSYEGALAAEVEGRRLAALGQQLAQSDASEARPSRFGRVTGRWRGDAFVGAAFRNSLSYSGEWRLDDDGQLLPSGFGLFENRTASETMVGTFRLGVLSGLGVTEITRDIPTRRIGTYDERGQFTQGAVFEAGNLVASGLFSPGGRTLVRDVALAR